MNHRNTPAAGEFYRHFKGNLYQIIGVAKHSETLEPMVVYQALYGDYSLYTRPLDMFLSPVDKVKYPEVEQEYRFEKVLPEEFAVADEKALESRTPAEDKAKGDEREEAKPQPDVNAVENSTEEETVRPEILRFLDAESTVEKLEVLRKIRVNMDEQLMTTIELSLDLLPDDKESLERRYDFVERTLEQKIRFEGGRLR